MTKNLAWLYTNSQISRISYRYVDSYAKIFLNFVPPAKKLDNPHYHNIRHTTEVRRQSLLLTHYFYCECSNCLDEKKNDLKTSLVCKKCNGCVPAISDSICSVCKVQVRTIFLKPFSYQPVFRLFCRR